MDVEQPGRAPHAFAGTVPAQQTAIHQQAEDTAGVAGFGDTVQLSRLADARIPRAVVPDRTLASGELLYPADGESRGEAFFLGCVGLSQSGLGGLESRLINEDGLFMPAAEIDAQGQSFVGFGVSVGKVQQEGEQARPTQEWSAIFRKARNERAERIHISLMLSGSARLACFALAMLS